MSEEVQVLPRRVREQTIHAERGALITESSRGSAAETESESARKYSAVVPTSGWEAQPGVSDHGIPQPRPALTQPRPPIDVDVEAKLISLSFIALGYLHVVKVTAIPRGA